MNCIRTLRFLSITIRLDQDLIFIQSESTKKTNKIEVYIYKLKNVIECKNKKCVHIKLITCLRKNQVYGYLGFSQFYNYYIKIDMERKLYKKITVCHIFAN